MLSFYVKFHFQMSKLIMHLTKKKKKKVQYSLCQRRNALVFFSEKTTAGFQNSSGCSFKPEPCLGCKRNAFYKEIFIALHMGSRLRPPTFNQFCFGRNTKCFSNKYAAPVSAVTCWQWTWHLLKLQQELGFSERIFHQIWCHQSSSQNLVWRVLHKIGEGL